MPLYDYNGDQKTMKKQTIICCLCGKEKPIEDGCLIAISEHKDRCKECQDKMQADCRAREKQT